MTTSAESSSLAELRLLTMDLMLSEEPFLCWLLDGLQVGWRGTAGHRGAWIDQLVHLEVSSDEELARHDGGGVRCGVNGIELNV